MISFHFTIREPEPERIDYNLAPQFFQYHLPLAAGLTLSRYCRQSPANTWEDWTHLYRLALRPLCPQPLSCVKHLSIKVCPQDPPTAKWSDKTSFKSQTLWYSRLSSRITMLRPGLPVHRLSPSLIRAQRLSKTKQGPEPAIFHGSRWPTSHFGGRTSWEIMWLMSHMSHMNALSIEHVGPCRATVLVSRQDHRPGKGEPANNQSSLAPHIDMISQSWGPQWSRQWKIGTFKSLENNR